MFSNGEFPKPVCMPCKGMTLDIPSLGLTGLQVLTMTAIPIDPVAQSQDRHLASPNPFEGIPLDQLAERVSLQGAQQGGEGTC